MQAEVDREREEADRLIEELAMENEHLRNILRIRDEFHVPDMREHLNELMRQAELVTFSVDKAENDPFLQTMPAAATAFNIKQMVADASV